MINDFETSYIIYEDGRLFNTKTKNWLNGTQLMSVMGKRKPIMATNGNI